MMQQEIIDYISQAQKHGLTDFEIKQNLLNAGWDAGTVEQSFAYAKAPDNNPAQAKEPPAHASATFTQTVTIQNKNGSITQNQNPISVAQQQPENPLGKKTFYKKPLFWAAIITLAVLAGGVYAYHNYVYLTPAVIWQNYLSQKKPSSYQTQYSFTYSSGATASSTTSTLGITGSAGVDTSAAGNLAVAGDETFSLQAGALSYNLGLSYTLLGRVLYLDLGDIPELKNLTGEQNLEWVKFDPMEIQNYLIQNYPEILTTLPNNQQLQSELKAIWSKNNIIQPGNFLAKENLNSVPVYHLKLQFNQAALNQAIIDSLDAIKTAQNSTSTINSQSEPQIQALLSRFKAQEFDVWIGRKDYQIYKIHLVLNAPSSNDFESGAMSSSLLPAGQESRDAQRLADVRKIQAALLLYQNDLGGYPAAATGTPQNLVPYYTDAIPTAPEPADGQCTDYFNSYWYKVSGKPRRVKDQIVYPSFTLTFCLGGRTGASPAGIAELTPAGISGNIACTAAPSQCLSNGQDQTQAFTEAVNKMDFAGQVGLDMTYSDLDKPQNIQASQNATDFLDLLKDIGSMATSTPNGTALQAQ